MFCDHFLLASHRPSEQALSFELGGCDGNEATLIFERTGSGRLPSFTVSDRDGNAIRPAARSPEQMTYRLPANAAVIVKWR